MNRRRFLRGLGMGAAASAATLAPGAAGMALAEPGGAARRAAGGFETTFGRLFPRLAPFSPDSVALTEALLDIGRPGGVLDAADDLSAGPLALIVDPELNVNNPNNFSHTAGTTFMGQFLDHDITFDVGSTLGVPTDPSTSRNGRTPAFDLDSVYGAGPMASPHLYDRADRDRFYYYTGGVFEDLPRDEDMRAVIADPRNDEHLVIAGLQCAFLKFHNQAVDLVRRPGRRDPKAFSNARQLTTWHYQWMIVHEFLPLFVGQALVDDILTNGRRFYRPTGGVSMPVEFQGAAYRFGHSMVRPSYRANMTGQADGGPFFGFIFDPNAEGPDPDDFVGGCRGNRRFVGWETFFDFGDGEVRPNKLIDTKLSSPLFNLPLSSIASGDNPTVLAQRTLLRHVTWSMPSGQAIARVMGEEQPLVADFPELDVYRGLGLDASTPLFYYVLKEAELMEDGLHLGPVGGRIVAEVMLGLLELDPDSYLNARPRRWQPTLPDRHGVVTGDFRMVDFLTFAGVDPDSRRG
jgi:hypothetical protein